MVHRILKQSLLSQCQCQCLMSIRLLLIRVGARDKQHTSHNLQSIPRPTHCKQ